MSTGGLPDNHTPPAAVESDVPLQLVCKEVWGGNRPIHAPVELPGLRGRLFSEPASGSRGGDVHFLSTCGSGLFSRTFVADVFGHGETVAAISDMIHNAMRQYMHRPNHRILLSLNRQLCRIGFDAMTTAAVVSYYPPRHWLSVSYAGHWPVWFYDRRQDRWEQLVQPEARKRNRNMVNLPLAVDADTRFTRRTIKARPGDRLVVMTDGVIEAPDAGGRLFGEQGISDVLQRNHTAPADALCRELLDALKDHVGQPQFVHDDVTLLTMEVIPGPKGSTLRHAIVNRILRPRGNSADPRFAGQVS